MTTGARSIGSRDPSAIFTVLIAPGHGTLTTPCATVQYAIDNATSGDVVRVGAGTFSDDVTMNAGVSVEGAGPLKTTLKGTGTNITGFTITGGGGYPGIHLFNGASPLISNDNVVSKGGYGIWCGSSSPTITRDNISGNSEPGIFCGGSSPVLTNNP